MFCVGYAVQNVRIFDYFTASEGVVHDYPVIFRGVDNPWPLVNTSCARAVYQS
jgi:hypothetical protein